MQKKLTKLKKAVSRLMGKGENSDSISTHLSQKRQSLIEAKLQIQLFLCYNPSSFSAAEIAEKTSLGYGLCLVACDELFSEGQLYRQAFLNDETYAIDYLFSMSEIDKKCFLHKLFKAIQEWE